MAKAASTSKVLWVLPRNAATELVGALIVVILTALLFSWLLNLDFIADNAWVEIVMWLVFAAIVGYAVGMIRGADSHKDLWIAAGFAAIGFVFTLGFLGGGAAGASVDEALLGTLQHGSFFGLEEIVPFVYIVLGIVAAATAPLGAKNK